MKKEKAARAKKALQLMTSALKTLSKVPIQKKDEQKNKLFQEALLQMKESAELGSIEGKYHYGKMILDIISSPKSALNINEDNINIAEDNLRFAADNNHLYPKYYYSILLIKFKKNNKKGMELLKECADNGNCLAMYKYGKKIN